MLEILARLAAGAAPTVTWAAVFAAVIVTVFVIFTGIALLSVLRARNLEQAAVRYQVLRDLLALFSRRDPR